MSSSKTACKKRESIRWIASSSNVKKLWKDLTLRIRRLKISSARSRWRRRRSQFIKEHSANPAMSNPSLEFSSSQQTKRTPLFAACAATRGTRSVTRPTLSTIRMFWQLSDTNLSMSPQSTIYMQFLKSLLIENLIIGQPLYSLTRTQVGRHGLIKPA